MKRPLPTSIPSIIPAAVLAEAKKKKLVYVGTGDGKTKFDPPVSGFRLVNEGTPFRRLVQDSAMLGVFEDTHYFLPQKTAAKFFDVPETPKTRYFRGAFNTPSNPVVFYRIKDGEPAFGIMSDGESTLTPIPVTLIEYHVGYGSLKEITAAEAKTYLVSPKKKTPLELLTAENTLLKARVAKLEAAIRAANKAL